MKFVCSVCGYVVEAESLAPDFNCPVCKAPASKFNKVEGEMKLAAEHVFGVANKMDGVPEEDKQYIMEPGV